MAASCTPLPPSLPADCDCPCGTEETPIVYPTIELIGDVTGGGTTEIETTVEAIGGVALAPLSGLLKLSLGVPSVAVAGVDYEAPLTFTSPLSRIANVVSISVGSMAAQNANSVAITGGTIAGVSIATSTWTGGTLTTPTIATPAITGGTISGAAISGGTITGLSSPSAASDAATKGYVDAFAAGITPRTQVVVATTANITLSGAQTVDGETLTNGDRVLVKNQSTTSQNGIYDYNDSGAWSRSADSNTAGELLFGYFYFVSEGSINGGSSWFIETAPTILGTDPLLFSQFSASGGYSAGAGLTLVGLQFSVSTAGIVTNSVTSTGSSLTLASPAAQNVLLSPGSGGTVIANSPILGTNLIIKSSQINEYLTNGTASVQINYDGYNGGTTQFRDFNVYNGKNSSLFSVTGSSGLVQTTGTFKAGDYATMLKNMQVGGTSGSTNPSISFMDNTNALKGSMTLVSSLNELRVASSIGPVTIYADAAPAGIFRATGFTGSASGVGLRDTDTSHNLFLAPGSNLTADRTLTLTTGDAHRTLTISGDSAINQDLTTTAVPNFAAVGTINSSAGVWRNAIRNTSNSPLAAVTWSFGNDVSVTGADLALLSSTSTLSPYVPYGGAGQFVIIGGSGNVGVYVGATPSALFTNTGLNNTVIGSSTPAASTFTTTNWSSGANKRTTKQNLNLYTINVRDFGAVGNGSTDDKAAIDLAIQALGNHSALYFPPGIYKTSGQLYALSSLTDVLIFGEGATIYNSATGTGDNTFVVNNGCDNINFRDLTFTGAATVRGSGIHIRLYSDNSSVINCNISGCSDFGIHISGSPNTGTRIIGNTVHATLGDGIHFGDAEEWVCVGNQIYDTGDDGIGIISDNPGDSPVRGLVANNNIKNSASAGIRINEADDITVVGNSIHTTAAAGIEVNRYLSTTAYSNRIYIKGNKLYNTQTTIGPRGSIWMNFCNECSVTENEIYDPANGAGICALDFNDLVIRGNTVRGSPTRAIALDDSTTTNVAANWYGLIIDANIIQWNQTNQSIYVVPPTGKALTNVMVCSNVGNELPSGDWIYVAGSVSVGKICNNTSRDGRSVAAGGLTPANNN